MERVYWDLISPREEIIQIADELSRRSPDRRKAVFYQQLQDQVRISPVMFLLPWFGRSNLSRIIRPGNRSPALPSGAETTASFPLLRSLRTPARAAPRKTPARCCRCASGLLHHLACRRIQHCQRLLASVQIVSYDSHLGLLRSERCWGEHRPSTRAVASPTSL